MNPESDTQKISPDELDAALETLWNGHSGDLERLLDRQGDNGPGVDVTFGGAVSKGLPDTEPEPIPTVANYTIVGELGRGGMGVIYEARQHHPSRLVALKVIRPGHIPQAQLVKLFEREVQSLARLKHPNVAAIHETGRTDDGRPFFAMELVRGATLIEFVQSLSTDPRSEADKLRTILRLFQKICDAIACAHQHGVVHRDLKPSNVLVSNVAEEIRSGSASQVGPEVKVLDFGLARIMDADGPASLVTDAGQLRGTLTYMAPEQLQGEPSDIDTRSDVYALGVLLFEMLTGRLPYDIKNVSMGQVVKLICESPPTRPSSLNPAVRGDLETIVLKALAKERDHRYQSVSALGEDLGRFLLNQPILARPHSALYQLRKLVARHRLVSFAVLAVILISTVGFIVSASLYADAKRARLDELAQRLVAERERDRAVEAEGLAELRQRQATIDADKAQAVTAFVTEMLSSADPGQLGPDVKVIDVLDRAAERLDTHLTEQAEVEAAIRHALGVTYINLSLPAKGEGQLRRASEIRMDRLGPAHDDTLESRLNLAAALDMVNKDEEAAMLAQDALETCLRERGEDDPATMRALSTVGSIHYDQGRLPEAQKLLEEAVERQQRVLGDNHKDTLVSMSGLGIILQERGAYAEAEPLFRHVAYRRKQMYPEEHPRCLVADENLASVLHLQGKLQEAERAYVDLLTTNRRVMGDEHIRTLVVINDLAKILQDQDKLDEAEPLFKENYETRLRVFGKRQQGTLVAVNNLAALYKQMERFDEAEAHMRETMAIARDILPEDHWYHYVFQVNLGSCLLSSNRLDEAEPLLITAHDGFLQVFGEDHPRVDKVNAMLADLEAKRLAAEGTNGPEKVPP